LEERKMKVEKNVFGKGQTLWVSARRPKKRTLSNLGMIRISRWLVRLDKMIWEELRAKHRDPRGG